MKRLLLWLVLVPVAAIGVAFAVANRHATDVVFDPFASGAANAVEVKAPLFLVIFIALALGVLIGGIFTWFGQGRHRRALRELRAEAARLRGDIDRLKT